MMQAVNFIIIFILQTSILWDTVGMGNNFTLQIHAKLPVLSGDVANLAWTDWAVAVRAAVRIAVRARIPAAIWAAAPRGAFVVTGYRLVSTRLCECNADASGVNWRNWVETVTHLGSSRGSQIMTWPASLTHGTRTVMMTTTTATIDPCCTCMDIHHHKA